MYLSKNIQFLIKELNKNKSKITKVFFTIFVSFLIFSSVTILKNSIETEIKNNSRAFLGGDIEVSTKNKPLNIDYLNQLENSFFLTEVIEFTTIISNNNQESKTTRIKVIDDFYPLVGNAKVEPDNSLKLLQTKPNSILIDKTTKKNLDLKIEKNKNLFFCPSKKIDGIKHTTKHLKMTSLKLDLYYGDADSDIIAALKADVHPIRVIRHKKSIEQYGSNYFGNTLDGESHKNPYSSKDLKIFYSRSVGIFGESIYPIIWEAP